jgi:predicted transcriptional regulator of viral defense system
MLAAMVGVQGVFDVAQALQRGMTRSAIRRGFRQGRIVRVRRGVYCERAVWEASAASPTHRHAIEVWAAILALGGRGWATGYSAAMLLGLPVPKDQPDVVELSLPQRAHGRRAYPGLRLRTASVEKGDVFVLRGVPMTVPARTALDITRNDGFPAGLIVADAALGRDIVRPGELGTMADRMHGWRKRNSVWRKRSQRMQENAFLAVHLAPG